MCSFCLLCSLPDQKSEDLKKYLDVKLVEKECLSGLSPEQKIKEQNRIRQLAFKIRDKMPIDYRTFCLVAAHLVKNAHRYFKENNENQSGKSDINVKEEDRGPEFEIFLEAPVKNELNQDTLKEDSQDNWSLNNNKCKDVNQTLRQIRNLKRQNRITEQQGMVSQLKRTLGMYRSISSESGIALKTVHNWCSRPKCRSHKGTV